MAPFALQASEEHFRTLARAAASSGEQTVEVPNHVIDTSIDKALAYISYYVLVFTAFCIFMPTPTANALTLVKGAALSPFVVQARSMPPSRLEVRWELCGTKSP